MRTNVKLDVLMIGPLPPPVGGQSILVDTIVKHGYIEKINYEVLNVSHHEQRLFRRIKLSIKLLVRLYRLLQEKRKSSQLVHIHTSAGIALYEKGVMAILSRRLGMPVILHIHGGRLEAMLRSAHGLKLHLIKYIISRMSGIVVLSNHMHQVISQHIPTHAPITVLGNPSTISFDYEQPKKVDSHVSLLFVGHIKPEKGLLDLLAAYMDLRSNRKTDIRLVIVGAGDTKPNESYVKKKFKDAGAEDVIFTGVLNGKSLAKAYSDADVFVLPSHSEDQPLTILEAMSCGVPVVATDVGSISEVVENGINGFLINPGDIGELAGRLDLLCNNRELRESISAANRSKALERFSIENYIRSLKGLYLSVLQ